MPEWTLEEAGSWFLTWMSSRPATQPGGLGVVVQANISGKDGPPWPLIKRVMESLLLSGIVEGARESTMPSDGTASFYQWVKFTPYGLDQLTSHREEIGF